MTTEMPKISKTSYSISSSSLDESESDSRHAFQMFRRQQMEQGETPTSAAFAMAEAAVQEGKVMADQRRVVQVFIADTDENLDLEDALLYQGEPKFTDLTDEELFFELNMKDMLDNHNAKRSLTKDKKATNRAGRDIYLEPARIRDLKMVVVDIAVF